MNSTLRISVASRAHRALRDLRRFTFASTARSDSDHGYGETIGAYENPPGVAPARIVVTERAIGCFDDGPTRWISFEDIERIEGPRDKSNDDVITVVLRSGIRTELRIGGGDGRFKDVFGFVRFIDRVIDDRDAAR